MLLQVFLCFISFLPIVESCFGGGVPEGYPKWQYKNKYVQDCWRDSYGQGQTYRRRCSIREAKELRRVHFDPRTGEEYTEPVGKWLMRNIFTTTMRTLPGGQFFPSPPAKTVRPVTGVQSWQTVTPGPAIDMGTDGDYLSYNGLQPNVQNNYQGEDFFSLDNSDIMPASPQDSQQRPGGDPMIPVESYPVYFQSILLKNSKSVKEGSTRTLGAKNPKEKSILLEGQRKKVTTKVKASKNDSNIRVYKSPWIQGSSQMMLPKDGGKKKYKTKWNISAKTA